MSLSSRWAADSHRAIGSSTSTIQRLAVALGPVRSVIRVIDSHTPAMGVDWCRVGKDEAGHTLSMSYTDFAGGRIAVNPIPVMELDDAVMTRETQPDIIGRAVDIATGFAMHEASHGEESRDRYKDLVDRVYVGIEGATHEEVPAFRPMRVAVHLWNLVEDVRIEARTSHKWPGFAAYFEAVLDWVWTDLRKKHEVPTTYGTTVADKLRVVFIACRYPDKADLMMRHISVKTPPVDPAEVAWWQAWQADYLEGRTDTRATIRAGLDHLGEDSETKAEMDQMTKEEIRETEAGERLRAQIDRLLREGIPGAFATCITSEGDMRALTESEAAAVDQLVREGFMVMTPVSPSPGASCPEVRISKPVETPASKAAYIGRPDATVEALRAALVFRQSLPRYDIKLQRSGDIDDEELYRHSMGDYRLFTERVIEGRPDTLMALLVDLSGSMSYGGKLPIAQRLAQLLVWALHDQQGVTTRVWGHTGDGQGNDGADIYRLWEPGDPLTRLGLITSLRHDDNYDSFAINYCVNQMVDEPQPQKVLVVLSDGLPAGHGSPGGGYGDEPARRHVRQVTDWARRQGVNVIQIAIDEDLRLPEQISMYGADAVVGYTSEADLPKQLTKVMSRWI